MDIETRVRELAQNDWGRTRITRAIPEASEHMIKRIIKEVKGIKVPEDTVDYSDMKTKNPNNFDVVTALRPIELKSYKPKPVIKTNPEYCYTALFFGDAQAPYHSETACAAACEIIKMQKDRRLDAVVNIGDHIDFYTVSDYSKSPTRRNQVQDEIIVAADLNYRFTEASEGIPRKEFVAGNHEKRLSRYINMNAPALASIPQLQVKALLGLETMGWNYNEDYFMLRPDFLVKHGEYVSAASGATAKKEIDTAWVSGISGHVHRLAAHYRTPWIKALNNQPAHVWIESGCLCMPDPDYMNGKNPNWQQGIVIVRFTEEGLISPELIPIHNGSFVYEGKQFNVS